MPTLPTNRAVKKWTDAAMVKLGLRDGAAGAWLSVDKAIENLLSQVGVQPCAAGKLHIQIMADAVRVYRKNVFTTVAIRALQSSVDYNSMTTLTVL